MNSPPRMVLLNCTYDLTKVCRSCSKEKSQMISLFNNIIVNQQSMKISDMLMWCSSLKISLGDGLPMTICHQCVDELGKAYCFIRRCEKSDLNFREYVFIDQTEVLDDILNVTDKHEELPKYAHFTQMNNDNVHYKSSTEFININTIEHMINSNYTNPKNIKEVIINNDSNLSQIDDNTCFESDIKNDSSSEEETKEEPIVLNSKYSSRNKLPAWAKVCPHCSKIFRKQINFSLHVKSHTDERPYCCPLCPKKFKKQGTLSTHLRITKKHSKDISNSYKCRYENCSMVFQTSAEVKQHKLEHQGNWSVETKSGTCEICERVFKSRHGFELHKLVHTGQKNHTCPICGKHFLTAFILSQHERRHTQNFEHLCSECGKTFLTTVELRQHQRTHSDEKIFFECDICHKLLASEKYMRRHKLLHLDEKLFSCNVCDRRFHLNYQLTQHMKRHLEAYSHTCKICDKGFYSQRALKVHLQSHSGERPFRCSECPKTYKTAQTYKDHARIHTGERPYVCEICDMTFARPAVYQKHLKRHALKNIFLDS